MDTSSILRHVRNYASAGVVSALVGFFTFPILTRNLSVDDYGIIGLITASTTLAAAFGKLGLQHAIVRYYAESMHNKRGRTLLEFNSTVFTIFSIMSLIAWLLWLAAGFFIVPRYMQNPAISSYFAIVSLVIILRMLGSATWNMLRARQESAAVSTSTIIGRSSYLAMLLSLLYLELISLYALLAAFVLAELFSVIYATWKYQPHFSYRLRAYSPSLVKALLMFGLPLMVLESLSLILRLIDRYMIGAFLGDRSLGLYAASYNLCSYIELVITASLAAAIRPMYTQIWETRGEADTCQFLSRGLHLYLMVGIPFAVVFTLVAPHLLAVLASDRYQAGTSIIPFITLTILADGALIFLSAGLYFKGTTSTLMFWGIVAGVVNMAGNYFVIPRFGIVGAASITLLAYLLFATGVVSRSMSLMSFAINFRAPALIAALSLLVYLVTNQVETGDHIRDFLLKGTLATTALGILLVSLDSSIRGWLLALPRWRTRAD